MPRRQITNLPSQRTGLYPSPEFLATCAKMRQAPIYVWNSFEPRCTGEVDWDLPLRPTSLQTVGVPLAGAALGILTGGVGVGVVGAGLGLLGGGGAMNGGFEQPIGIGLPGVGGVGIGICPPGTRCLGPSAGGVCLGTCVPSQVIPGGPAILPGQIQPIVPAGGVPTGRVDPYTGQLLRPKRRRMNYSNQKALRRALRRATGYARQQKAVKKAAAEFAREFGPKRARSRRDLPRGHAHVR
jgi:hypothetical protein